MRRVYLDTSFLVALIVRKDAWHTAALVASQQLTQERVTTFTCDAVLVELLTFFSEQGPEARAAAVSYAREVRQDRAATIEPLTTALYERALDLYERRPDKSYSMVDAIGMVICADRGITDVLSADRDFEQEGLTILLK